MGGIFHFFIIAEPVCIVGGSHNAANPASTHLPSRPQYVFHPYILFIADFFLSGDLVEAQEVEEEQRHHIVIP